MTINRSMTQPIAVHLRSLFPAISEAEGDHEPRSAIHEASHAVVATLEGLPVESISIREEAPLWGSTETLPLRKGAEVPKDTLIAFCRARIAMAIAAAVGETKAFGDVDPDGLHSDLGYIAGPLEAMGLLTNIPVAFKEIDEAKEKVEQIFGHESDWSLVQLLATDLRRCGKLVTADLSQYWTVLPPPTPRPWTPFLAG